MSQTKALLFPGQGSQFSGMLSHIGLSSSTILNKYQFEIDEFSKTINFDFINLIENKEHEELLGQTQYTQPALLFTSCLAFNELITDKDGFNYFAGHSLGEYSALVCANSMSLIDALHLVYRRGNLMASAPKGAMSAVLGLDINIIDEVCNSLTHDGFIVQSANKNTPLQTVISGSIDGITKAEEILKDRGAKRVIRLNVSVASHSSLMKDISHEFLKYLEEIEFSMPAKKIIQNVSIDTPQNLEILKMNLVSQLYSPVNWVATMNKLSASSLLVECGPGKVLTGLGKQNNVNVSELLNYLG